MKKIDTCFPGLILIEKDLFNDDRGFFTELFSKEKYAELGIETSFVQDNLSFSKHKGTFRGFHWQNPPFAQAKLVTCLRGSIIDFAVDIRKGSPTFAKVFSTEISLENKRQLFIPRGFAHGFITLTDDVEFSYKCDNCYNKDFEASFRFDSPEIGIDWKSITKGVLPILSDKDKNSPDFKDSDNQFIFGVNF